jgi:ferrous iron transport protein A
LESAIVRLSDLRLGESAVIESFTDESIKLKLMEMGCLPGEEVIMDRYAPLGDPLVITITGSALCMRKDEADTVKVRKK